MSLIRYGRNFATILALSSLMSRPFARAMDARTSGDMFFIICSAALIISGLLSIAEGSMSAPAGMPPMGSAPPSPPRICELIFIISSSCCGPMLFIISDICFVRLGSEAICSMADRIMSAWSLLLMLSFFRSSSFMFLVMAAACWSSSGLSNMAVIASEPDFGAAAISAPAPPTRLWLSIRLRSSSGMAWRLSMADFSISGFFRSCSIWLLTVAASMPGGSFWPLEVIIFSSSSGDMLLMRSVASFSTCGFSTSCSAALAHLSVPGAPTFALLLLELARLPLEVEGVSAGGCCHSARTACFTGATTSSLRPCSLSMPRSLVSSAAMALSPGDSSAAVRTSATASPRVPSSAFAWPLR
mmetsp:Transcript_54226/g.154479  ORF Transcript_54226/g.154479 Transcript_54226/m.154479 type:complete len:357 (-) Transcript_54226:657-1727(-)